MKINKSSQNIIPQGHIRVFAYDLLSCDSICIVVISQHFSKLYFQSTGLHRRKNSCLAQIMNLVFCYVKLLLRSLHPQRGQGTDLT
jgi:hypothetical protein